MTKMLNIFKTGLLTLALLVAAPGNAADASAQTDQDATTTELASSSWLCGSNNASGAQLNRFVRKVADQLNDNDDTPGSRDYLVLRVGVAAQGSSAYQLAYAAEAIGDLQRRLLAAKISMNRVRIQWDIVANRRVQMTAPLDIAQGCRDGLIQLSIVNTASDDEQT